MIDFLANINSCASQDVFSLTLIQYDNFFIANPRKSLRNASALQSGRLMLSLGEFLTVQGRSALRLWLAIISHYELTACQLKDSESGRGGGLGGDLSPKDK